MSNYFPHMPFLCRSSFRLFLRLVRKGFGNWNGGGRSWLDIEIDGMGFGVGGDEKDSFSLNWVEWTSLNLIYKNDMCPFYLFLYLDQNRLLINNTQRARAKCSSNKASLLSGGNESQESFSPCLRAWFASKWAIFLMTCGMRVML